MYFVESVKRSKIEPPLFLLDPLAVGVRAPLELFVADGEPGRLVGPGEADRLGVVLERGEEGRLEEDASVGATVGVVVEAAAAGVDESPATAGVEDAGASGAADADAVEEVALTVVLFVSSVVVE